MFFQSWSDFFNMGGYGFYVWLAYGISFAAILLLAVQSYRGKDRVFREVRRERDRERRLKGTKAEDSL